MTSCPSVFLLLFSLAAAGCAETAPSGNATDADAEATRFCSADNDGNHWQCIESTELAARTPVARPSAPASAAAAPQTVPAPAESAVAIEAAPPQVKIGLLDMPEDYYVVQLVALTDRAALEAVAAKVNLPNLSAAAVEAGGRLYYILLQGAYPDRATAERAAAERPAPLRQFKPWVRSIKSLKDGIWRAQAQTASVAQ